MTAVPLGGRTRAGSIFKDEVSYVIGPTAVKVAKVPPHA